MLILISLLVLMVGVVLVGLKVIWKDNSMKPPSKTGHFRAGWPASLVPSAA